MHALVPVGLFFARVFNPLAMGLATCLTIRVESLNKGSVGDIYIFVQRLVVRMFIRFNFQLRYI